MSAQSTEKRCIFHHVVQRAGARRASFFLLDRYRHLTKVCCHLDRCEYVQALPLLARLLDYFSLYHRALDELDNLILLGICRFRMDGSGWANYLNRALTTGQRYGYVTVFAEKGIALLPLLNKISRKDDPVSSNTLKTHIRHLFSKLNAKNRNDAREIAQRLLLEP